MTSDRIESLFKCPRCGAESAHPDDIREGYCSHCHDWTRVRHPGPPAIEPGQCPSGVVIRVYAVPSEALVTEQHLRPGDDVAGAATMAAEMESEGWGSCLVAYDGDTGRRFSAEEWTRIIPS